MCTLGVTNISFENRFDGNVNVIVTYKDHRSSALARRFLMNQGSNIFNTQKIVLVDWAKRNRVRLHDTGRHLFLLDFCTGIGR